MTATLPNGEALVVGFLAGRSALSALSGAHVGTVVQDSWTGYAIRVSRVGGSPLSHYGDSPLIQLDCWSSKDDRSGLLAAALAFAVAAELPALAGQYTGAWISNVNISDGPLREADDQGRPRYRIDFSFDVHITA